MDLVGKALERGRERAQAAGVEMKLVQGDVTRLSEAEVGSGFRLILDRITSYNVCYTKLLRGPRCAVCA